MIRKARPLPIVHKGRRTGDQHFDSASVHPLHCSLPTRNCDMNAAGEGSGIAFITSFRSGGDASSFFKILTALQQPRALGSPESPRGHLARPPFLPRWNVD